MTYKAVQNFKASKVITQIGEIYSGDDVELLLGLGLIALVEGDVSAVQEEPVSLPESDLESESPPKKGKKKKG